MSIGTVPSALRGLAFRAIPRLRLTWPGSCTVRSRSSQPGQPSSRFGIGILHEGAARSMSDRMICPLRVEEIPTGDRFSLSVSAVSSFVRVVPVGRDRAFNLLRCYITLPHNRRTWKPLDRHGGNSCWNALWALDPGRSVETLLEAAAASPLVAWRINWQVPEILDLTRDREILLRVAQRNEHSTEFISSCLESAAAVRPPAFSINARLSLQDFSFMLF